ncbi:MBL fold metallo-hydrolase [Pedobacter metabolipauper]|uniref:L-ascorbate metabolism protein UlaG (Beta-lactamase superfamily) n=1 Tax=Pedobacter metabolipauper TaxID=425513 RepID=A0A4R6T0L3_9SPHI|nr:MBL fold metallo-hydrolase [Pedobacter metabolipauper]TDQ11020.1 L-ascorbate metabolism protein UlaG (beta-lactamase superfamily) [Pedobacter metabolipauper]
MNKSAFLISAALAATIMISCKIFRAPSPEVPVVVSRISNPDLKTILPSWKGTPLDKKRRFMNHEFPGTQSFGDALKWMFEKNPQKQTKKNDTWQMQVVKDDSFLHTKEDVIVLLGHSTFFIRLNGKQILIDPIFGKLSLHTRYTEFPIETAKLKNIDYVLISHSHYDHCDKSSLKIIQSQNPAAIFLAGLNMKSLLSKWVGNHKVQEAGWYQQYKLDDDIDIIFLPARHSSRRSINDVNERLWGAFVLKSKRKTIYYGGDSGYGSHYKEAGKLFPDIDVALIGVGAYSPRWFMSPNHQDPQQAVQAFNDTRAKMMVPFHYGTFDMADEPLSESETILGILAKEKKVNQRLKIVKPGETVTPD